jgi:hypothetical protein
MEIQECKENIEEYIFLSKQNINELIKKNDYKNAFCLLILVLERIDNADKIEFINYYSKNLIILTMGVSHHNFRH